MRCGIGCRPTLIGACQNKLLDSARFAAKFRAVSREITLSGGEISLLKALRLTGAPMAGKFLIERMHEMETGELIDTLEGLIAMGYVLSSKVSVRAMADVEHAFFRVNPAYAHTLRESIHPSRTRETTQRRRRRS
jgi:hypothetical protein